MKVVFVVDMVTALIGTIAFATVQTFMEMNAKAGSAMETITTPLMFAILEMAPVHL